MNVFERYAPFIQDYIYRSGWQSLRAVQNAAGEAVFGTEDNVLLTASTASGKTEAAFFPILTLLVYSFFFSQRIFCLVIFLCEEVSKSCTVKFQSCDVFNHSQVWKFALPPEV